MTNRTERGIAALGTALSVAVGAVAAVGVFARGNGETVMVTSPRGEAYAMATTGVYAWNAQRVVAEGVGWDIVTLGLAAPAMLIASRLVARGSFRAKLVLLGLFAYAFYQYLMYAMTWAFGPLFLPFVALYAASLAGIVWLGADIARAGPLAPRFAPSFPRKGMAVLAVVLSLVLVMMWLGRIRAALAGDLASGMLLGQTTMVVQGLDLGLIVPLSLFTAVTAWRGRPVGYVLSSVLAVKGFTMASAICAMVVAAWKVEGKLEAAPLAIFAAGAAGCLALGVKMLGATREGAERPVSGSSPSPPELPSPSPAQ